MLGQIKPEALGMKFCRPCGRWLPATTEFFCMHAKKGVLRSHCKECRAKDALRWRRANLERARKTERDYARAHAVQKRKVSREFYERNRDRQIAKARAWAIANPQRAREICANATRVYQARKQDVFVELIDRAIVFERDEGVCGICGEPVVGAFHVDHIIPLSKGGSHSYDNVQLAHPTCNLRKGASLLLANAE